MALITREDQKKIKDHFDAVTKALERSELVIANPEFSAMFKEKQKEFKEIKRKEAEKLAEYKRRRREHLNNCMIAYLQGFIMAHVEFEKEEQYSELSFAYRNSVVEAVAKWLVGYFTQDKYSLEKRMERRWYNRWYAKNIRRAKSKGGLTNAYKNAT